jgi:hypothetical protein
MTHFANAMTIRKAARLALAILVGVTIGNANADTLDRIAVTVGHHVITESDILLDLRVAAFLDGKTPDLGTAQKRKAADRLVDQYLILEDAAVTRAPLPFEAEVANLIKPVRARYASDSEYQAALAQAGITQDQVEAQLLAGLRMMRYTDLRFRPEVQIADKDVREAFAELAAKQPAGSTPLNFEESRDQLEELLMDRRITETMDRWLAMTRAETQIQYKEAAFR